MNCIGTRRQLGFRGPEVAAVGLGCMGMSDFYGPADEQLSLRVLHRALDLGINFFDTADVYGPNGANERLLAQILLTRRDEVVLATKFGQVRDANGTFVGVDGRPEYVRRACDDSLRRLEVDHIDLYYQHRVDRNVPIEETVGAMARLVEVGKVRYLGLSEAAASTVRRAARVHAVTAVQTEYSLWSRDVERDVLPVCRELGISLVAYSPLGRGFLAGAIRNVDQLDAADLRRRNPRFQPDTLAANAALLEALSEIATLRGCTCAQLALSWLLHRGPDIVPIPGVRALARLEENCAAATIGLTSADVCAIEQALVQHQVAGARYPPASMAAVNI